MLLISLIGFPDESGRELAATLTIQGYRVISQKTADELPTNVEAIFICGDVPGWLEMLCHVRAIWSRKFLAVATRLPDYEKWLDALEAGANDYFCTPLDGRQLAWLLRRESESAEAPYAKARI